jgi:hypothetical protein
MKIKTTQMNNGIFEYDDVKSVEIINNNFAIHILNSTKNFNKDYVLDKLSKHRDTDPELWSQLSGLVSNYGYLGSLEYLNPNKKSSPFRDNYLMKKHRKILEEIE